MIGVRGHRCSTKGLASCILGLVVTPYVYLAMGAPLHFPLAFSLITLPPLVLSSGFLFWRFLSGPSQSKNGVTRRVLEAVCVLSTVAFLVVISNFSLFTGFERVGIFCASFLGVSACCLPVFLLRPTALEQRLQHLPRGSAMAIVVIVVGLSGVLAMVHLLASPELFH